MAVFQAQEAIVNLRTFFFSLCGRHSLTNNARCKDNSTSSCAGGNFLKTPKRKRPNMLHEEQKAQGKIKARTYAVGGLLCTADSYTGTRYNLRVQVGEAQFFFSTPALGGAIGC